MGITINGTNAAGNIDLGTNGTITDLAVGGLPDGTVDGDTVSTIPASKLTGDLPAISGANLTGISSAGSFRNLIDNGAFKIAQRGTSKTGITDSGRYVFDRWQTEVAHDGGYGTYTLTQESSTSLPDGHTNSYKLQVTTADATVGTNDMVTIYTTIEAQNLVRLRYGTSDALTTTLSFWVRTNLENKTGFVMLYKNDNVERMICKSYTTHGTANTWKKVTLTFPGDTTGAINNDNGGGVSLQWFLCAGATQSVDPPTSWANYNSNAKAKGTDIQIASSTNNYYELTGVQWEIGSTATDYEHRTVADELWTCRRYFQASHGDDNDFLFGPGYEGGGGSFYMPVMFNPPMRAAPTMKVVSGNWKQVGDGGQSSEYTGAMSAYDQQPGPIHTSLLFWKDTDYPSSKDGRTQWMRAGENSTIVAFNAEI